MSALFVSSEMRLYFLAELAGRCVISRLKLFYKIGAGGKADCFANILDAHRSRQEQLLTFLQPDRRQSLDRRDMI